MTEAALAAVLLAALALPHALPLARVNPATAAAVWLGALGLRAVLALGGALAALLVLPATPLFEHVAGWSVHVLGGPPHVDLTGEPVAHLAALAPPALLALSLLAFLAGLARGALLLRGELARRALGGGPGGSLVIADRGLLVAVPGLGRRRVVLSDRALAELDPAELRACLAHESGHLRRRHRALGLLGGCLAVLARPLPGAGAARRGLLLSLERDADEYAVARTGDPLALASAICKVAQGSARREKPGLAFGLDGAGGTRARLEALLAGGTARGSAALERAALAAAILLPALALAAAAALVLWLIHATPPAALAAALSCRH
jgi:Zn-dependent protease with chaperone function